jgi:hypothetical protein
VNVRRESADGLTVEEWRFHVEAVGYTSSIRVRLMGYTKSTRPSRRHKRLPVVESRTFRPGHRELPLAGAPIPDDLEAEVRRLLADGITVDLRTDRP